MSFSFLSQTSPTSTKILFRLQTAKQQHTAVVLPATIWSLIGREWSWAVHSEMAASDWGRGVMYTLTVTLDTRCHDSTRHVTLTGHTPWFICDRKLLSISNCNVQGMIDLFPFRDQTKGTNVQLLEWMRVGRYSVHVLPLLLSASICKCVVCASFTTFIGTVKVMM